MNILALDTSTEACSCALLCDGQAQEVFEWAPQQHSSLLLPMIQKLLQSAKLGIADLDAIAYARGPGSFTGIRIGISIAQGLALAHEIPLIGISSLHALAWRAQTNNTDASHIISVIDARMGEVYWAEFANNKGLDCLTKEQVTSPTELKPTQPESLCFIGSGADQYQAELKRSFPQAHFLSGEYPHAQDIASIVAADFARFDKVNAEQAVPVYLRDQVAEKKDERKNG